MEKLTKVLPLGLFCAFSLKLIVVGAQLTDSIVLLVLAGYSAYHQFSAVDIGIKRLEKKIEEQEEAIAKRTKEIEDVKALLNSVKLGQSIRNSQIGRN